MDKNPKIQIFKCDIFGDFQPLCIADKNAVADSDTLLSLKLRRFSTFLKNVKSGLEIPLHQTKLKKSKFFPIKAKHDIRMAWSANLDKLEIPTRVSLFVNATKRLSLRLQSINPFLQRVPNWIEFENSKEASETTSVIFVVPFFPWLSSEFNKKELWSVTM